MVNIWSVSKQSKERASLKHTKVNIHSYALIHDHHFSHASPLFRCNWDLFFYSSSSLTPTSLSSLSESCQMFPWNPRCPASLPANRLRKVSVHYISALSQIINQNRAHMFCSLHYGFYCGLQISTLCHNAEQILNDLVLQLSIWLLTI